MKKGTIIAIGGGFDSHADQLAMAQRVMELSGKEEPNFLFIPTSAYDSFDDSTVAFYSKMGCNTDVLYLTHAYMTEEMAAAQIRGADIIRVPGGNLKFLMRYWNKFHIAKYMREAYESGKILFGGSTGSMCWFAEGYDDCGPDNSFMFVDATGIIPYCNCPHYEGVKWQTFNEAVKTRSRSAIACENETALVYSDGKYSLLIASSRPDARVWFFDANDGFKRYDLREHPEILEKL